VCGASVAIGEYQWCRCPAVSTAKGGVLSGEMDAHPRGTEYAALFGHLRDAPRSIMRQMVILITPPPPPL
jgi:hypothetical protein